MALVTQMSLLALSALMALVDIEHDKQTTSVKLNARYIIVTKVKETRQKVLPSA